MILILSTTMTDFVTSAKVRNYALESLEMRNIYVYRISILGNSLIVKCKKVKNTYVLIEIRLETITKFL